MQRAVCCFVQAGSALKVWIRIRIAGQEYQLNAVVSTHCRELVHAICPVGATTKQTNNDKFGVNSGLLQPQINRKIVTNAHGVGQTQLIKLLCISGVGQRRKFGVSGGQKQYVGWRLSKVNRFAFLLYLPRLRSEKMH